MSYTIRQAVVALEFLTPAPPVEALNAEGYKQAQPPTDKSWGSTALAKRLNVNKSAAIAVEDDLVLDGLMLRTPGYRNTPRFILTDAGHAYLVLARRGGMTAEKIISNIPRGPCAADPISMRATLNELLFRDIVTSDDGGVTFRLVT